jgi:hypothetical protein
VPRLPRVVSPLTTLLTRGGIDVLLVSVELWPEHVVVRLAASGDRAEELGSDLLAPLRISVEDDAPTTYAPRSGSIGGSGSEWHGDWFFAAGVPEGASRLRVRVEPPGGEVVTVELDLADV